jgi:hypothetical protein
MASLFLRRAWLACWGAGFDELSQLIRPLVPTQSGQSLPNLCKSINHRRLSALAWLLSALVCLGFSDKARAYIVIFRVILFYLASLMVALVILAVWWSLIRKIIAVK